MQAGDGQCSPGLPPYQTFQQPLGRVSSTPRQRELGGLETESLTGSLGSAESRPLDADARDQGSRAGSMAPTAQWPYRDTGS